MPLILSEINIFPVKSLGGFRLSTAAITNRGLEHDRRWLLTDENNEFITQRTHQKMALLKTSLVGNGFEIHPSGKTPSFTIPFQSSEERTEQVKIWDDVCDAIHHSKEADEWFGNVLETTCKLFFMSERSGRFVEKPYLQNKLPVNFADAMPYLIIGQSSLDDLNKRLKQPLPMNRFRPNFVFSGGLPYEEDTFREFKIGDVVFEGVKLCSRCAIPTIDQDTGMQSKEPTATMATYRSLNHEIFFGQNLVCHSAAGKIKTGDAIEVISRKNNLFS